MDTFYERDIEDIEKFFIKYKGNYKLELQPQDSSFFHDNILGEKGKSIIESPAQEKLMNAKKRFQEWISTLDEDSLFRMLGNIREAKVLIYTIKNKKEASMIFETTNDRGKPLTNLEKLKSYLMYKISSTLENSEQKLKYIEQSFTNIYTDVEKLKNINNAEFNEDDVLRYNFIGKEDWKASEKKKPYQHYMEILKDKIDELIKLGNEKKAYIQDSQEEYKEFREYIENYIINLKNTFDHMLEILSDEKNLEVNDLKSTEHMANFYPLLIKCYPLDESENKDDFKKICRLCEIFSFRVYVMGNKTTSKAQSAFYNLARDFKGDFEWLQVKIANLIRNNSKEEEFIGNICREDFYTEYNANERNYFFWKYENYLRTTMQPYGTPMPHMDLWEKENKKSKLTIEHIVAQSNNEDKQKIIEDLKIIDIHDIELFDNQYLHSIGNLTLDPQSANSSKGKKNVQEKNCQYFKESVYKSQKELDKYLEDKETEDGKFEKRWTIQSIENRKEKLVDFARTTWCAPLEKYPYENEEKEEKIKNTITVKQYTYAYELAKRIQNHEIEDDQAVEKLEKEEGMNRASADLYITGICNMLKGISIGANIKNEAIKYVLDKIFLEFGLENIEKALYSIEMYAKQNGNKKAKGIRNIYEEYREKFELLKKKQN